MTEAENIAELAEAHVDWFLEILRPILISFFEHGYKHGFEECFQPIEKKERTKEES